MPDDWELSPKEIEKKRFEEKKKAQQKEREAKKAKNEAFRKKFGVTTQELARYNGKNRH